MSSILNIIYDALLLALIALALALALSYAARAFYVKKEPKLQKILNCLPNLNCGACGYSGCEAYAKHILAETAPTNCCVAGGNVAAHKISQIMGKGEKSVARCAALIACSGAVTCKKRFAYKNVNTCFEATTILNGALECSAGCIGLGSCATVCPVKAISLKEDFPAVDRSKCIGCARCAAACPRHLIKMIPDSYKIAVFCSAGKRMASAKVCSSGCVSCSLCEKVCPSGAISMTKGTPKIRYELCIDCGKCAEICKRKVIKRI